MKCDLISQWSIKGKIGREYVRANSAAVQRRTKKNGIEFSSFWIFAIRQKNQMTFVGFAICGTAYSKTPLQYTTYGLV